VAEFFAGVGLVRLGVENAGFRVVFANDIDKAKESMYLANFPGTDYKRKDVRLVRGEDVPNVDLATASFPCTDLSLAGNRAGLKGKESGLFWEFARILSEMGVRAPEAVLVENVPGFATSHGGKDLHSAVVELNNLGYVCDLLVIDAKRFVPQSRKRLFIIGTRGDTNDTAPWQPSELRPTWICEFREKYPELKLKATSLPILPDNNAYLGAIIERLPAASELWWGESRTKTFVDSLSDLQSARLERRRVDPRLSWATAYRRTRHGKAVWEIRADNIAGCLRTTRGGSSKQAVVEAGKGKVRVRWMTPREYARLQGAPDFVFGEASESQARFAFGDAVCVPAIQWLADNYLAPVLCKDRYCEGRQ
jgi:DNA (cytosine-5)-methyltransferase 1